MRYAGFWIRFLAAIIDSACLLPFTLVYMLFKESDYGYAYFLSLLIGWLYGALLESSVWQATLGKRMVGIKVTDENGLRISFGRASGRHFAKYLSGLIFGIGYLMVIWTQKKQALHDMIANTVVVNKLLNDNLFDDSNLHKDNKTEVTFSNSFQSSGSLRWILAGFDSTGHVVRIGFDFEDPKLFSSGLIIGRGVENSDIFINDSSISRKHARIFRKNSDIWIQDLESTNGILINGEVLIKGESAPLPAKGTLTLGGIIFSIGRD